ncbi:uncharacterized protein TNCV_2136381 [Trichonephila clavipes]|nr:uncharacterized protein TNCV_2136381 [Trichonephila clavipes]
MANPLDLVSRIENILAADDQDQGLEGVVAHKLDGTFGLVYSFPNYIKVKWEGGIHKIHKGITLEDGIVFSAEKLSNGTVVLLDVYQVGVSNRSMAQNYQYRQLERQKNEEEKKMKEQVRDLLNQLEAYQKIKNALETRSTQLAKKRK